ncbi:hypothetical protein [uncultured Clostridium sp.]|uniref:hypothetical protein n=1 Tax=uncultured Clostridium sp. TaxID=59620 RepID=UPI0026F3BC27|nr:hypothetical protein [uncultured Clostridium sp.]
MEIKDIIKKYCSYDIAHPLVIKHYNNLVNYLNVQLYNKRLNKDDYEVYLTLVKKQMGEIPFTSIPDIIERYRSKYYNGKHIEFILEGISAKEVLRTTKACNSFCYIIAEGFKNGRFSQDNATAKAMILYLCNEIKDRRKTRDNYWYYVSALKFVLPLMIKNKYVSRDSVTQYIKILQALLKEEKNIEDDFYKLETGMNTFSDNFDVEDYTQKLNIEFISAFLESEDALLKILRKESEKNLDGISNTDRDKISSTIQKARENFLGRPQRRFNSGLLREYCNLKQLNVKYPWIYCYTYPDYVIVETFKVLDAFRKDFTENGVFKVLIDMYIVNARDLLEDKTPSDMVKKVTMERFRECLKDMIDSKIIALDLFDKVMTAFEKVYDYYYGGNKNGK